MSHRRGHFGNYEKVVGIYGISEKLVGIYGKDHEKTREKDENLRKLQCWHVVASFGWSPSF